MYDQMANPLALPEFTGLMTALPWRGEALAIAVSGGPDSMALALLLHNWTAEHNIRLLALTVDHALRTESADEAVQVGSWLRKRGIAHETLRWDHPPLTGALQKQARTARYALLAEACFRNNIDALALAHQQEDQAETVLMRFAKGSGIDGLAGMKPVSLLRADQGDMALLRPLLAIPKARLIATCNAYGQDFFRDPGNESPSFARGRLRNAAQALAAEGMDAARLGDLAARAAAGSEALEFYTQKLLAQDARHDAAGYAELTLPFGADVPEEIRLRALSALLQSVGGGLHPPPRAALSALLQALEPGAMPRRTLHGCEIAAQHGRARIVREFAAIHDNRPIMPGQSLLWDRRFRVTLSPDAPGELALAPLGFRPHTELDAVAPNLRRQVPSGRARAGLPALVHGAALIAIPGHCDWAERKLL